MTMKLLYDCSRPQGAMRVAPPRAATVRKRPVEILEGVIMQYNPRRQIWPWQVWQDGELAIEARTFRIAWSDLCDMFTDEPL